MILPPSALLATRSLVMNPIPSEKLQRHKMGLREWGLLRLALAKRQRLRLAWARRQMLWLAPRGERPH